MESIDMKEFEKNLMAATMQELVEPCKAGVLRMVAEHVNDAVTSQRIHKNLDASLDLLLDNQIATKTDIACWQICTHEDNRDGTLLWVDRVHTMVSEVLDVGASRKKVSDDAVVTEATHSDLQKNQAFFEQAGGKLGKFVAANKKLLRYPAAISLQAPT